jgi:2-iminobutanoate/2-iminopropanoate deaminase
MWTKFVVASVVAVGFALSAIAADPGRQYFESTVSSNGMPLPFSDAVRVGDTIYVAGHIGLDPKTQKAPDNIDVEAHAVMDSVKRTVESAGLKMDDLVSVTIYCTDLELYEGFNAVYRSYFHGHYPARAFIGINHLVRGAHFEITGVAVKPAQ